jgi:hypothetical protein
MSYTLFEKTQLGSMADVKTERLAIEGFADPNLFITNLSGGAKPNYQLMYSLGDDVFLNTFSDRLSMWELKGLHIMTDCNGKDLQGEPPFLTFYKEYNVRTEQSVRMTFASIKMNGFLVKLQINNFNQTGVEGFSFVLSYLALLENMEAFGAAAPDIVPQTIQGNLLAATGFDTGGSSDSIPSSNLTDLVI